MGKIYTAINSKYKNSVEFTLKNSKKEDKVFYKAA